MNHSLQGGQANLGRLVVRQLNQDWQDGGLGELQTHAAGNQRQVAADAVPHLRIRVLAQGQGRRQDLLQVV